MSKNFFRILFKACLFSWLALVTKLTLAASLDAITIKPLSKSTSDITQIKLTLTGSAAYKVSAVSAANRLIIDLNNTKLNQNLNLNKSINFPIEKIRSVQPDNSQNLHLIINLKQACQVDSVSLNPIRHGEELILQLKPKNLSVSIANSTVNSPANLVVNKSAKDIESKKSQVANHDDDTLMAANEDSSKKTADSSSTSLAETENAEDAANSLTLATFAKTPVNPPVQHAASTPKLSQFDVAITRAVKKSAAPIDTTEENDNAVTTTVNSHRPIIIVIDAGHGGKDPGTIGVHSTQEKDVVLAISKTLQETINQQTGFRALLTRNRDYFIPLRQRLRIARQDKGDMFVAIHADAYQDSYAAGASVFALNPHGASSEAARWLAEKENYSELGGVSLADKSDVLRSVLIDLAQTAVISSSVQIGGSILQQIGKIGPLHHGYVEQAPFMVLKNPDIPSLLVESGFLSNPQEEARLRDSAYQQKLAAAICTGIKNYFTNDPPPGTLLATLKTKNNSHHV